MKRVWPGAGFYISLLLFTFASSSASAIDFSKPVNKILIEGASRADKNTVRFYIHSKTGKPYNAKTTQEDIRRVYKLGFFDDIRLDVREEPDGLILTFIFKEKPFVREKILTGAKEVDESTIQEKLKTKKGTYFRQDFIPWDEAKIRQIYRNKGYHFTEVRTVVHKLDNNQVDVEYVIDEGEKIIIGKVIFRGNEAFSDKTLQGQIETKAAKWTSVISGGGGLKKDALKADVLRLESFYHDNGYIKVKVKDPVVEIDKEKRKIYIRFSITENSQYHVGDISIQGDEVYSKEELLDSITLKKGDVFNRSVFRKNIFNITDLYSQKGYAFANVKPQIIPNDAARTVSVNVTPMKGRKVYIGKIIITGNNRTRDRVIRRQFLLQEGELFDSEKLRISRQRINSLAYFESVEIEQKSRQEEDLIDIELKVIERQTGQFSFSVGYSSVETIVLQGQLRWTNLMGRGQNLSLTVNTSSRRNDYSVSFTEPALFDRRLSGGIDVFNREFQYDAFRSRRGGGSLRVGRGLGQYTWGRLGYKYENNNVIILKKENASFFLRRQEGKRTSGSFYPSVTYDDRNDPFNPTKGKKIYGYAQLSGFGGNEKFYKLIAEYTQYRSIFLDFVGMFHAKVARADGYSDRDLPVFESFFMGGPRSVRGFTYRDIGPLDENGEAIGGEALLQFNLELQYSFTKFFRGFLFYDRGNVYSKNDKGNNTTDKFYDLGDMRHSWGVGIHFFSPMGPISIAYGFKLDKRKNETPSEFHFTIGGAF